VSEIQSIYKEFKLVAGGEISISYPVNLQRADFDDFKIFLALVLDGMDRRVTRIEKMSAKPPPHVEAKP